MTDLDAFREQVKSEAEDAVNEQLGRSSGGSTGSEDSDDSGDMLSSSEIASRGWELSDYNSFFADCRKDGYGASDCGSMWTAAKESGLVDTGSVEPADSGGSDSDDGGGEHILMLKEGAGSSDLTAQYLADPIMDGEIDVVAVESDVGQNILESLDDVPAVPAHLMMDGDAVEVRDLETLFDTYTDPT